jgi:hypothetical protein
MFILVNHLIKISKKRRSARTKGCTKSLSELYFFSARFLAMKLNNVKRFQSLFCSSHLRNLFYTLQTITVIWTFGSIAFAFSVAEKIAITIIAMSFVFHKLSCPSFVKFASFQFAIKHSPQEFFG